MSEVPGVSHLPERECWELLRNCEVARLAVSVNDVPDIFPINFVIDHGTILFRTAEGTKLSATLANPEVAFEADGLDVELQNAWSVVVKGRAQEVTHLHELIDSMDLPLFPWHGAPKSTFIRITPETISGRSFHKVDRTRWDTPTTGVRRSASE